jgi:hypothetical protein
VPPEFQSALAALDRLDDDALWRVARSQRSEAELERYDELLDRNQNDRLTAAEQNELTGMRKGAEQFMLCKAQAAVLLRWRGHSILPEA